MNAPVGEKKMGNSMLKNAYVNTYIHNMTRAVQFHSVASSRSVFNPLDIVLLLHPDLYRRFGAQMKGKYANLP